MMIMLFVIGLFICLFLGVVVLGMSLAMFLLPFLGISAVLIIFNYLLYRFLKKKDKGIIFEWVIFAEFIIGLITIFIVAGYNSTNSKRERYDKLQKTCCIENGGEWEAYFYDKDKYHCSLRDDDEKYDDYHECTYNAIEKVYSSYDEYKKQY